MSKSPSSLKKMLDSLNEIDPVAVYTSSDAPSPSKMSTISSINIGETSPLNPQSLIDLNNPALEPGPCSTMLSDHLYRGDLPENKLSESNILPTSKSLVWENVLKKKKEKQVKMPSKGKKKSKASVAKRRVLGGRVFDPDVITKHGMNSLYDLTKSPVLHEEEVRESYYNIVFEENGSITTRVGDKKSLCKFDPIDLPTLMLEHMYKIVVEHKVKHDMEYYYLLTKVFHHMNIPVGAGKIRTAKQSFTLSTLVECKCIKGKGNPLSKAQTEGLASAEVRELRKQNEVLFAKIAALQDKAIKDNDEANIRLTLIIKSPSHQPHSL
ncbi:hypothetical protein H5410_042016 [Solanum commersonii]|uniref:Uncharacterized protein n=1 Tax=Solanum commersonii TaxID=4109 RepID=A0A9J5XX98_SOLCO|nr:hypothetical protein H5410_042016 [Solanum commersonii]